MFQAIRYQLLFSYLAVLTVILGVFAIAVRITFARSLDSQLIDRLETLARAAALELELEGGELEVDEESLISPNQAIQWFDTEGNLLAEQGDYVLTLPLNPEQAIQTQIIPYPAKSFTVPVHDYGTGVFIGYTRVSESSQDLNHTLRSLDLGLGVGVVMALVLSGLGGIWLTRQAMQPIEQSFRRLQRFTSDASHELRGPLMAIKTNAAVALRYPEGMRNLDGDKFRAIESASAQLTALTENLLLLARTDQAPLQQQEIVDLSHLLKQLLQLYRPQFEDKQIHLKAQLHECLCVVGDKVQLSRLFTNLLDNALRYTSARGVVEIQTTLERECFAVSVEDTGIGIAPEHLQHIFERFWQADPARAYQAGGFGLGLAIAQGIAQNHNGKITVTSELGRGSCFTVGLPAYRTSIHPISISK
jgi:two-component system, OmpR family, manganese sensing sensor histidine kinase